MPSTLLKVNEIFYSIQGEGYWTGRAAVFVRFAGCNLECPFCDTKYAKEGKDMSPLGIITAVRMFKSKSVIYTGGEPTLQDYRAVFTALRVTGWWQAIETNGTRRIQTRFDWITVSPKTETLVQDTGSEMKLLWGVADPEYMRKKYPHFKHYFLQPISQQNTEEVAAYCMAHPEWRLSIQAHKYAGLR